jgi:superfamily II DNA or RNA helicase
MLLRPYQQEAVDKTKESFANHASALIVMATGLGKTVVLSHLAKEYLPKGRVMMLAHREELLSQGAEKLEIITGERAGLEKAENYANNYGMFKSQIVVASVQTLVSGQDETRMERFNPSEFSLLITDEAHHACAASYRKVYKHFEQNPALRHLGVTATPDRSDEKALGLIYKCVPFEYGIREGIDDGWLVPIEQNSVYVEQIDISQVRTTAGDLNGKDLAAIMEYEESLHGIASPTIEIVGNRKALVFAASVPQAERLCEILNRHKSGCAEFVHGGTAREVRRQIFKSFAERKTQFLVNVGVATEGFDDPGIEVVVMARPTKSRCLYTQMVGRGTRPLPGIVDGLDEAENRRFCIANSAKPSVEVIDFVGNCGKHKLVTSADVLGGNYEDDVIDLAKKTAREKSEKTGKPVDMMTELKEAERQIRERARMREEAAIRDKVIMRAQYSTSKINPFDIFDVMPNRVPAWHKERQMTAKQAAFLQNAGIDPAGLNFSHASQLVTEIITRRNKQECSFKQAKILRKYGVMDTHIGFQQASKIIDMIAKSGWKRPDPTQLKTILSA